MSQPTDQDFEKDEENREEIVELTEKIGEATPEEKSLVVSEDVFPESLIIVPLYDRPLFPKMLLPVIISDEKLEKVLLEELKESLRYVGLVYSFEEDKNRPVEGAIRPKNLAQIGAVGRIVQASKHGNDPMHIIVQVLERFEIKEVDTDDPVLKAKVEYLQDTGGQKTEYELKAFSVSMASLSCNHLYGRHFQQSSQICQLLADTVNPLHIYGLKIC